MLKIVIIKDEAVASHYLESVFENIASDVEVVRSIDNSTDTGNSSDAENSNNKVKRLTVNASELLKTIFQKPEFQERFMVVSGKKIKSIPVEKVAYFIAEGRYIRIVSKTNEQFLLEQSLESISQKIDPQLFFRINRQVVVSFDAIAHMMAWSRSRIKIELSPSAPIDIITSIDNTAGFRKWLDR